MERDLSPGGVPTDKAMLRARMKAFLASVGEEERGAAGRRAADAAVALPAWAGARLVLAFLSMPTELDTGPLVRAALEAGKRVACPRIAGPDISFIELSEGWRDWPRDRWGIPAPPAEAPALSPEAIASTPTLALVPGLAFDTAGGRLGRGKGYYDRFLAAVAGAREALGSGAAPFAAVGLGYRGQLVPRVPMDERDRALDGLALG